MKKNQTSTNNQKGFASIIIAITLVIVTSLLVVGFAKLARNEQSAVTNRQLSNQAYYAAEAGINDAAKALKDGYVGPKTTCGPLPTGSGFPSLMNNNVDGTAPGSANVPVQWTCLLIDPSPTSIEYSPVSTVTPKVIRVAGVDASGTPVTASSITFSWQDADASNTNFRTNNGVGNASFPAAGGAWNSIGMLRVSLVPLPAGAVNRDTLKQKAFTAFLYPTTQTVSTSGAYSPGISSSGIILNGSCATGNAPRFCSATISGLDADFGSTPFLVTMRSIYSTTNVSIKINGGAAKIVGAQTKIDSTGRSQDVLKRLQVRIPSKNEYNYPGFAVETSGDICKDLSVYPGSASGCGY